MTSAQRRRILVNALKLFDLAVMMVAFALATVPASGVGRTISAADFFSMRVKLGNLIIFLGLLLLWHLLFSAFGLYGSHRLSSRLSESFDIVKATALSAGVVLVAAFLFHIRMASLRYVGVFFAFSTVLLVLSRLLLRFALVQTRLRGRNLRHVLVVGTSKRALEFADKLEANQELGYCVIGFADQHWDGITHFQQGGKSLLCDLRGLPEFLRSNVVDEVVIALPMRSFHDDASRVAAVCEQQGIIVRVLPNIFDLKMARSRAEEMEGDSVITHYTGGIDGWPVVIKRVLDFSLALAALIVVSPVMLLAAAVIRLTSPGPVFFTQKRIGQNKRKFTIYKFRTMAVDAEAKIRQLEHLNEVSGPVFKIKDDPRITPVGRFLRKTSIDELPQLFNVLKSDMSLVGPRPLPIRDYEGFSEDWHRRRFSVRPGITCLWQVNGRNSIPFEKWMELDMQYIDKWSLWLDFKILARTIPAVLKGFGAA
jgi:exopolysaccharide biosynthesis polyprenyl glycosylphosphotransferase